MTEVLSLSDKTNNDDVLGRAGEALAAGRLVSFPTETVYALAADASTPKAIDKLNRAKQRPEGQPYSLLLADREGVLKYAAFVPVLARKLLAEYWPGPLTVVFPARDGGTVGLRLPANDPAREIIRRAGVPVAATSANPSGQSPATTADHVLAYFDGIADIIVDGGPARLHEASAVVKFTNGRWEMLRSGVIDRATVAKVAEVTIVFACTGNSCRSPMAEALCKKHLAQRMEVPVEDLPEWGYHIISAGTNAPENLGASSEAVAVMSERGCDLSGHRSRQLDGDMIREAELIFVMTPQHREAVLRKEPTASDKVHLLTEEAPGIPDPIGGGMGTFTRCAVQIDKAISRIADEL